MKQNIFTVTVFLVLNLMFVVPWSEQKLKLSPRILKGDKAQPNQFTYMVSLRQIKQMENGHIHYDHFCGAALISESWVISAAHCFNKDYLNSTNIRIFVGVHHITKDGIKYKVERIIKHENYNRKLKINDISLLQTTSSIWFNEDIQPIAISKNWIEFGQQGEFAGFGLTAIGVRPRFLKHIRLTVISNDECIKMHSDKPAMKIYDSTLCVIAINGAGICYGDSGGILAVNKLLTGIMSWGIAYAQGKPYQFTRVSSFVKWIEDKTNITAV